MEERKDKPTQTAVYSEFVGSLKDNSAKQEPVKKKRKAGKNDWMRFSYPNRAMRRTYDVRGAKKYERTKEEIKKGVTPFQKMMQVLRDNHEHGDMLHQSFTNEVATDQMHGEHDKEQQCKDSLTERFGNELGMKMYYNNKRLQGSYDDKKNNR